MNSCVGNNGLRKIGVEIECFIFDNNNCRIPVNKCATYSASDLLEELNSIEDISTASFSLEYSGVSRFQTITMLAHAKYGEINHSTNPTFVTSSAFLPSQKGIDNCLKSITSAVFNCSAAD